MTFYYDTPVLGILNEADAPHQNMLVVVFGKAEKLRWAYVVPRERGNAENFYHEPELFTPLQAFGVHATLTPDGRLALNQLTISAAKYPSGQPRHWQGSPAATVDVHHHVTGHVVQAIQNDFASRRKAEAQAS